MRARPSPIQLLQQTFEDVPDNMAPTAEVGFEFVESSEAV